jgi:predicted phage terminase large subunit-like protein
VAALSKRQEKRLHLLEEVDRIERARRGLLNFTVATMPEYEVSWHHRVTAQALNRFVKREVRRLMIFMPPRVGKSELASRRLPAFIFGQNPDAKIMGLSYAADLADRNNRDVQRIMESAAYRRLFPKTQIGSTTTAKGNWKQTSDMFEIVGHRGEFRSAGSYGGITGMGGDYLLIDDPVKGREDADSKAMRDKLHETFSSVVYTRLEKDACILLMLTRWHEDDLAGRLLRLAASDPAADQWEVVCFPAIRETADDQADPRLIGEALWPGKFDLDRLRKTKATVGTRTWSALYQQKPTPDAGAVFKREWWKFYTELPPRFDRQIQSWDFAVKDKTGSDFAVGQVWGQLGARKYLIAQVRGRWSFPDACQKVLELSRLYPKANKKLIEAKANGPAIKQTLDKYVPGLIEVEPRGDKLSRAHSITPDVEAGNVYLPDPSIAPWVNDYLHEHSEFPAGTNDDQVDSTTQALDELRKGGLVSAPMSGHSGVIF